MICCQEKISLRMFHLFSTGHTAERDIGFTKSYGSVLIMAERSYVQTVWRLRDIGSASSTARFQTT